MDYTITKSVKNDEAFFTIRWSPIIKAERYSIIGSVPAMGGVAELYYKDKQGKLNLYMFARSYYGGLRATLRVATDPDTEKDERRRAVLLDNEGEIYYRYSLIESQDDMTDILFFFMSRLSPQAKIANSNRYKSIFINEVDANKLTTL